MRELRLKTVAALVTLSLGLTACGGGGSSSTPTPATYSIGGTVNGLAAGQSVALLDNGGDSYTATANGPFTFGTGLASGTSYAVTVGTQPTGQACSVTNSTGTMASSNITSVTVNCLNLLGESVLYSFGSFGSSDGAGPSGLVMDSSGNLYGTTYAGGTNDTGTVFKITPAGTESVLHSFGSFGSSDGQLPDTGLVMDSSGNLYGTTDFGGTNSTGTVFKITPAGTESVLHSFGSSSASDGQDPSVLVMDSSGNLYGTTYGGGTIGGGTVFKITPAGTESVLYSFGSSSSGSLDGAFPSGLVMDSSGNLYGTTYGGGSTPAQPRASGAGTVFKITPDGTESVLYLFGSSSSSDGKNPDEGLVMDSSGTLYGTTPNGGTNGSGTVFRYVP